MWRTIIVGTFGLAIVGLCVFPLRSQENRWPERVFIGQVQPGPGSEAQQGPSPTVAASPSAQIASQSSAETPTITVVLDPAHGGADFGARGPTGLAESDVVLDFARAARIALEAERLRVLLTREGNQDPSFDNRSALVNGLHNAIFISLHVSSTGPVGTGRTYYYVFPSDPTQALPSLSSLNPSATAGASASGLLPQMSAAQSVQLQAPSHPALVQWDRAQRSSAEFSRQLATLVQNELAPRLKGSPPMPIPAPVRQLRSVAAPAIAIEVSSIEVADSKRLEQMAQPLADAISKAVAEFHYPANAPARAGINSVPATNSAGGH